MAERGSKRGAGAKRTGTSLAVWAVLAALLSLASGCCQLAPYRTPDGITDWQETAPPEATLAEKARFYEERIATRHLSPEGVLVYRRRVDDAELTSYGNLADTPFHTGIYAAGQAARFAATGDAAAREQVLRGLSGLELLMNVTGVRGLLARNVSPARFADAIDDDRWRESPTVPEFIWRSDVSKDQYAGFIHGLGLALALVPDESVRRKVAALSSAAADHLIESDLRIVDADGETTTFGDLRSTVFGLPKGVDSLLALAIARVAALSTGDARYEEFHARLLARGYVETAYWAHLSFFGSGNRVNDHMAYLALTPLLLLLLEDDWKTRTDLRRAGRRSWAAVKDERNAFFAVVHAGLVGDAGDARRGDPPNSSAAAAAARAALAEFPENKTERPVDLTRPEAGLDFPRAFLNRSDCMPRSRVSIPLYLRVRSSSMWASDPYRLAGRLHGRERTETTGADYLLAYWLARHFGIVAEGE